MNKTDLFLLNEIKNDNEESYRTLFFRYYRPLLIFALKFVEEEIAKDFIQDCFLSIWQDRSRLNIQTSLSSYLFAIIRNRCFKHLKMEKSATLFSNDSLLNLKQEELNYYSEGEESLLQFDLKNKILNVVEGLPEQCRKVFSLSRFEGKSNKEIAANLDVTVKAVEKQITKALKIFRTELKDYLTILVLLLFNFLLNF